jgi:3',5'-nucleoside bisphosphate phosphatase
VGRFVNPPACDLHTHTLHSDGELAPEALVACAAARGVRVLAVTDHDTLDGYEAAARSGDALGVEVIAGVELSVQFETLDLHLLGYFVRDRNVLESAFLALAAEREERAQRMLQRLAELGYTVEYAAVRRRAHGVIGRPHIAAELVERGFVRDAQDAFDRLLGRGKPAYFAKQAPDLAEGVALLRRAGAVPALAHPHASDCGDALPRILDSGVLGLEVWHPTHDAAKTQRYLRLTRSRGLLPTGGSDFHRETPGGIRPGDLGVTPEQLQALRRAAG